MFSFLFLSFVFLFFSIFFILEVFFKFFSLCVFILFYFILFFSLCVFILEFVCFYSWVGECCWLVACACCSLLKDFKVRPNYVQLLEHPFIKRAETTEVDMAGYITSVIERLGPLNEGIQWSWLAVWDRGSLVPSVKASMGGCPLSHRIILLLASCDWSLVYLLISVQREDR